MVIEGWILKVNYGPIHKMSKECLPLCYMTYNTPEVGQTYIYFYILNILIFKFVHPFIFGIAIRKISYFTYPRIKCWHL